ncbi:MAG: fused MFS/spermidine synthase [Lachnospiraceae bacterium]|jgi:spermidine synthase|nr:fused MFS/spermidine synthase [Lachnospiraceae bacterium]
MKEKNILNNKYFLYLTEFFSGMSVMAVELGASRLMAPYFSSSQIVWTVIIGVIMIAMALGNVWGGRLADRDPSPDKLYGRLLLAAVWIALIPFVGRYLIGGISLLLAAFVTKNFLVWAALFACLAVFAFPCVLLGTVTPSLVKYTVSSLDDNGKTVGELGALNTIGSIIGTFLPTFVTIPAVGTAATFLIFSGVLAAISILYFLSQRKKTAKSVLAILLILALGLSLGSYSFAFWEEGITLEDESIYNYLQVKETDSSVILSTNVLFGVQSILMKHAKLTGMYYDYALAAPLMAGIDSQTPGSILILGLGTGTFAKYCSEYFPECSIEGVEIDEKIARLAAEYFALPDSVEVSVYDGRSYLAASDKKYDVILVDAYQDITIPFQMSSAEFFTEVRKHLSSNGVMAVNMNMKSKAKDSINDYLCDTINSVFPYVYTAPVANGTNCEAFAFLDEQAMHTFEEKRKALEDPALSDMMETVSGCLEPYKPGDRILTDDKAPVEVLGMKALDEIIADELDYYRELYLGQIF